MVTQMLMTYLIYNTEILYVASVQQLLSVINTIGFYGYFLESKRNWTVKLFPQHLILYYTDYSTIFLKCFILDVLNLQASSFFYTWVCTGPIYFDELLYICLDRYLNGCKAFLLAQEEKGVC